MSPLEYCMEHTAVASNFLVSRFLTLAPSASRLDTAKMNALNQPGSPL